MQHDEDAGFADEALDEAHGIVDRFRESPYVQYVRRLAERITGKEVASSSAGRSGFLLRFNDDTWVTCYLADEQVQWADGVGEPSAADLTVLGSASGGDYPGALRVDPSETIGSHDIAEQVPQSHGKIVIRVGIDDDCFSLCFSDACELATTVVFDECGQPSLRIVWEQWS